MSARVDAVPGSVGLMRGVPHRYLNFTDRDATLLIVTTPGALCGFFKDISPMTPVGGRRVDTISTSKPSARSASTSRQKKMCVWPGNSGIK